MGNLVWNSSYTRGFDIHEASWHLSLATANTPAKFGLQLQRPTHTTSPLGNFALVFCEKHIDEIEMVRCFDLILVSD